MLSDLVSACRAIHASGVKRDRSAHSTSRRAGAAAAAAADQPRVCVERAAGGGPLAAGLLPPSLAAVAAVANRREDRSSDLGGLLPRGWGRHGEGVELIGSGVEDWEQPAAAAAVAAEVCSEVGSPLQPRRALPAPFPANQQPAVAATAAYDPQMFAGEDEEEQDQAAQQQQPQPWQQVLARAAAAGAAAVANPSPAPPSAADSGLLPMRQMVLQQGRPQSQHRAGSAATSPAAQRPQQPPGSPAQHLQWAGGAAAPSSGSLQMVAVPEDDYGPAQLQAAAAAGQLQAPPQGLGSWAQLKELLSGLVARLDEADSELAIHRWAGW
jgi:hypothetical protein